VCRFSYTAMFVLALAGLSAQAHHSISGMYDSSQRITITGVIAEFRFVQPHPFLVLETDAGKTERQRWHLELDNHRELVPIGITEDSFKPGDKVIVSGSPARNGTERLYIRQLDRPADGLRYEAPGFQPSISVVP